MEAIVEWTAGARRSYSQLLLHIDSYAYGNREARAQEIHKAIQLIRYAPYSGRVLHRMWGKEFRRRVTVKGRFLVYYLYDPPSDPVGRGLISIRGVKHASEKQPFAGVREPQGPRYCE